MTSNEFLEGLADVMGVERTELATVDRALAKRGMRQIARGRFRPDITLAEGLSIVLGWAGARNLTLAADELERFQRFYLIMEERVQEMNRVFEQIFGVPHSTVAGENLPDLLIFAARNLGAGRHDPTNLWVEVEKDGRVEISFRKDMRRSSLVFMEFTKFAFKKRRNVKITVGINGVVLKWIFDVTEGK